MENKNYKGLVWLVIILIILVVALMGFIVYREFYSEDKPSVDNTNTTAKVEEQKKLTEEEIKKYLSYVPFSHLHDDAYIGEKISISNIDKAAILFTIYNSGNLDVILSFEDEDNSFRGTYDEKCVGEFCVKEKEFNDLLKKMYNITISDFKQKYLKEENANVYEEYLYNKNGYYYEIGGYGATKEKSDKNVVLYEIINNELVIKEQIGFISGEFEDATVWNGNDLVKTFEDDSCVENNKCREQAQEYVKNNINSFNTYKHTFKQHDDGTYYWYSTEVVK